MTANVLITGPMIADEAQALLTKHGLTFTTAKPTASEAELREIVAANRVDALIVRYGAISAGVINASDRLRVIANHGVGYDNIDVAAASARGIPVLVTRGANARSVAEHALALILALVKNVRILDAEVREGRWRPVGFANLELTGRRLGLVGFGAIGRELAALVAPFRMDVWAYDPLVPATVFSGGVQRADRLVELLSGADVVSLHVPLTAETRHLINRETLRLMKRSAVLVNTARGAVIDEAALIAALRERVIAGAGLDVFVEEPSPAGNPLLTLSNVISSPHVAGVTRESFIRMGVSAAQSVIGVLEGTGVDRGNLVNPEALAAPAGR